uniref:Ankyrin repeat protein n=1 Tax=Clandestinovirus TaxID=2831644 RepID=A0A8F8KLU7_9VIRU|nr:ankyrin repeat protein [Clandestinovirus]
MTRELPVEVWRLVAQKLTKVEFCLAMMTAKSVKNFRYGVPMIPPEKLPPIQSFVDFAASSCNPALMTWLRNNNFPHSGERDIINKVVHSKCLPMFKAIQKLNLFSLNHIQYTIGEACLVGWVELLEYLFEICPFVFNASSTNSYCPSYAFEDFYKRCIDHGRTDCFKFLITHITKPGAIPIKTYAEKAARVGRLGILEFLNEQGINWDQTSALYEACKGGHLPCLIYIHHNGGTFTNLRLCVDTKDEECKGYLHANGFECEHTHPEMASEFRRMCGTRRYGEEIEDRSDDSDSEDFDSYIEEEDAQSHTSDEEALY